MSYHTELSHNRPLTEFVNGQDDHVEVFDGHEELSESLLTLADGSVGVGGCFFVVAVALALGSHRGTTTTNVDQHARVVHGGGRDATQRILELEWMRKEGFRRYRKRKVGAFCDLGGESIK